MGGGGFLWFRQTKNAKHHCRTCGYHVCDKCSKNTEGKLLTIRDERACKRCYTVAKDTKQYREAEFKEYLRTSEFRQELWLNGKYRIPGRRRLVHGPRSPALKATKRRAGAI